jgi:hypothetical protein
MSKVKDSTPQSLSNTCGIILDLSRTTKEKIAYHNGKEYFRLNRAGSAHAGAESK